MALMKRWLAVLIGCTFATQPVLANDDLSETLTNGNAFLRVCGAVMRGNNDPLANGLCFGLMQGVVDRDAMDRQNKMFCIPGGTEQGQMMDVALAFMRDNPAVRNIPPALLVATALKEAFPCK